MSNYNSLKTTIDANIKQNGRQEITGQILNSVLNQMVTTLGAGYQFAGVATTATNPGSPDAKVFYIANGKGIYTNFGGLEVTEDEVVVLYWDTSWHKESTGIASQEKLTELDQKVFDGANLYTEDGLIYVSDGSEAISSYSYKRTGFIPLANAEIVKIKGIRGSASGAAIFFYDENKIPIEDSGIPLINQTPSEYNASIPENAAYLRSSTLSEFLNITTIEFGSLSILFSRAASNKDVDMLKDELSDANGILEKSITNDAIQTKTPNGYWGLDGRYYETTTWRTTVPIKVSVGDCIQMEIAGQASNLTLVSSEGVFIKTLKRSYSDVITTITYSFDFEGYIAISYRAKEGLTYHLAKSGIIGTILQYTGYSKGYDGKLKVVPATKSPNGYWAPDRNYYASAGYRTSVPIEVRIGDKIKVTAAGNVSMISRVYPDGKYMKMIQQGADTIGTYNYISAFNGYIAISWRNNDGLDLEITKAKPTTNISSSLEGVKWGAMGDSFTDPATLSNQTDTRNYVDLIMEKTGIIAVNYGKSGSGYKAREAKSEAFYQVALTVASDLDVITIFGSGNDQNWVTLEQIGTARDTGTTTLCGCMNTAIDNLISINPLIRIGLITPTPWRNYPPDSTTAEWMKIYSERIVEVAALRGIPCLDLYHDSNLRPWNDDALASLYIDNGHPNTEGHKRIASQIKAFLIKMVG